MSQGAIKVSIALSIIWLWVCMPVFAGDWVGWKNVPTGEGQWTDDPDDCKGVEGIDWVKAESSAQSKVSADEWKDYINCCPPGENDTSGSGDADTGCLYFWVSTGKSKPGIDLPGGTLNLWYDTPTDSLYTPQGLRYNLGMMVSHISTNNLTANGVAKEVTIYGATCKPITFEFADNVATGMPSGSYSASLDRLVMKDASGNPVTNSPRFYDLHKDNNSIYRYGADSSYDDYKGLVQYTTPYGRISTLDDGGVKVLRDEDDIMRQISVSQCLVDIITLTDESYELKFYSSDNKGTWNPTNELYEPIGAPFVVYRVEDNDGNANFHTKALISRIDNNNSTNTYQFTYAEASGEWKLEKGGGLRTESRDEVWDQNREYKLETYRVKNDQNQEVYRETKKFYAFSWGERLVEKTIGTNLITTYSYYESTNDVGYKRLKTKVSASGAWTMYDYDEHGRVFMKATSWKDVQAEDINAAKAIWFDYTSHDVKDAVSATDTRPRTATTTIAGKTNAISYYVYYENAAGEQVEITEKCLDINSDYGDTNNQKTVRTYYPGDSSVSPSGGKLKSVEYSDGKITTYTYEYGNYHATSTNVSAYWFEPDANGDSYRETVVHGTMDNTNGIANKTTKNTTIYDEYNNVAMTEEYVYTGSDYERISWKVTKFDFRGKPEHVFHSDGTESETIWASCGCTKDSETDTMGTEKTYSLDLLNRVISETKKGTNSPNDDITTSYILDARGGRLSTTTSGGGLRLVTSTNVFDLAGRMASSKNSQQIETIYQQLNGGRDRVTVRAGVTNATENYLDGRRKCTKENGVIKQYYDYGVNSDGSTWTKVYSGPDGASSSMWSKTTTDPLGRTMKTEHPGFGGSIVVSSNTYNNVGQLVRTQASGVSPQPAATLYEYNELGDRIRSGLDIDGDGTLDVGEVDRVNESEDYFEQDGSSDWWRVSVSKIYAEDNSSAVTTNSIQKTRLTGLGVAVSGGALASETVSMDIYENQTVSTTAVDRDTKTVMQTVDYPDSTNDAVSVTINGLLMSNRTKTGLEYTYGYDGLKRRILVNDPRIGSGITHYNALGQVDYVEDAATNRTSYAYSATTGRRVATTNAFGKVIYTEYSPEGQMVGTWGATYPVLYDYDDYDRMIAMYTLRSTNVVASDYSGFRSQVSSFDKTTWLYDEVTGLLTNKLYADANGVAYTYFADGQLHTREWARGITTTYGYDPCCGTMTNISYSDSTPGVSYTYTRIGLQNTITDAQGTRTFGYNSKLQRTTETIVANGVTNVITRSYDSLSRGDGIYLNAGYDVDYGFSNNGRFESVQSVVSGVTNVFTYLYLASSDIVAGVTNSAGSATLREYEPNRNLITEVKNTFGTNVVSKYNYVNDVLGRRVERLDQIIDFATTVTNDFGYNNRSEVIAAMMGTNEYAYIFDNIGNRESAISNGTVTTYEANQLNQYTEVVESVTNVPIHDLDGNMTSFKDWTFTWNGENRMIQASNTTVGTVVDCKYDYMGRRFSKAVDGAETRFIYDGWNMIQESSATKTNHYVWGLDLSQTLQGAGGVAGLLSIVHGSSSTTAFYCFDGNGSVMQLVDVSNGTVLARYVYGPFGNIKNSEGTLVTDNPYRFSTKYTDFETELVYYGYRYYDPDQGRWINRDPIGNEINIGLYLFVDNSATSSIDAFGLYTINNAWNSLINEGVMPAISGYYDPLSGMYVPASYSDQQLFDRWVELESNDANWLTQIPDCPDRICVADEEPVDCTNGDWKSLGAADQTFHPEAKWCMRSDTSSGPGQQCCYDEKGKLRKSGLAAGTPDRQAASFWNGVFLNHYFHDVKPFNIAWDLDGGNGDLGANLQAYLDVRPPSQGGGSCYQ